MMPDGNFVTDWLLSRTTFHPSSVEDRCMPFKDQQEEQEEKMLVDAAASAERRSYAVSMAAVVKSLTCAEPATAEDLAVVKLAEAESRAAVKALEDFQHRH
jgi:hypothetical protein